MTALPYPIREDEHCLYCGSKDLSYAGQDEDGWWVGMECAELHCNACAGEFAVGCDETDDYRAFREAHPNGRYSQARQAAGQKELL